MGLLDDLEKYAQRHLEDLIGKAKEAQSAPAAEPPTNAIPIGPPTPPGWVPIPEPRPHPRS